MAKGRKTGGRKPGSVNKTTASVKAALSEAFDGTGGVGALKTWAEENRTAFYQLWAKMLPQEVTGADGGPIDVRAVVILPPLLPE